MEKKGSVTIGPGYLLPLPLWSRRGGRDVFLKQSILSDAEQNTEGLKIVYDDLAPYAKENSTASITRPGLRPRLGPVSYTHLDVYKRQVLNFPARQLNVQLWQK